MNPGAWSVPCDCEAFARVRRRVVLAVVLVLPAWAGLVQWQILSVCLGERRLP